MQVLSNNKSQEIGSVILANPARVRGLKGARLHEKIEQDQQRSEKGENHATGSRTAWDAAKRSSETGRHSFEP